MGKRGLQNHLFRLNALVCWTVAICAVAITARPATLTVTNTNDSGPGSLRQTIAIANGGDTITFAVSGSIMLTTGELLVDKSISISGPGAGNLAVDGNANGRVFHIGSGTTVTIAGLTIRNGMVTGNFPTGSGGGIYSFQATLTLNDCAISGNSAPYGGGVTNDAYNNETGGSWAVLTISNSTLSGNSAGYDGGGVFNSSGRWTGAVLTINNSTFSMNSAGYYGGGIDNNGYEIFGATVTLNNSMLSGNSSAYGGGICNSAPAGGYGSLEVNNSTLADNSATYGGGGSSTFPTPAPKRYFRSETVRSVATPPRQVVASIMKVMMMAAQLHISLTARSAATRPVASVEVTSSTPRKAMGVRWFISMMRFSRLARRGEIFLIRGVLSYRTGTTSAAMIAAAS